MNITETVFHLIGKIDAKGKYLENGDFVVFTGSGFSQETKASCPMRIRELREELINKKKIVDNRFVEDVVFSSPSYAASVIAGRTGNGMRVWRDSNGNRLSYYLEHQK